MGWFGNDDKASSSPAQTAQSGPTLDSVRAQLEQVGQFRLQVRGPEMKVLLTLIAWNGEPYLARQSATGAPSGAQLVKMASGLETTLQIARAFAQHEQQAMALDTEAQDRSAKELEAVKQYATSLQVVTSTAGFAAGFNADVNIDLLTRLSKDLH